MDNAASLIVALLILALILAAIVLPIVALTVSIRTRSKLKHLNSQRETLLPSTPSSQTLAGVVQQLTQRVARLEAAISAPPLATPPKEQARPETGPRPESAVPAQTAPPRSAASTAPPIAAAPPLFSQTFPVRTIEAADLESIIGRRWLGWAAIALILFATAFFFKYAFDNRWIGELGRVAIGVAAGLTLTVLGFRYHQRRWRIFSQILTGGGIVLLYLSAYASFGYYHLATQKAAFAYLAILIAEAAGLALMYNAPAIAVMALIGGFLVPLLLRSDRDQYQSLFGYIAALDVGAVLVLKCWSGLSSLAFLGTHLLFWLWYVDNYHPRKLSAVMIFHLGVFGIFLVTHLRGRFFRDKESVIEDISLVIGDPFKFFAAFENLSLLLMNAFVFFATAYYFLNPNHHDWMAVLAVGMAMLYAGGAKLLLARSATSKSELLLMIGIALTFVTIAIPIQLKTNWITIAWAVEGLAILWAGLQTRSRPLRSIANFLIGLALAKLVFWDTPLPRQIFTPILNKYFLSSVFVIACVFAAAFLYKKLGPRMQIATRVLTLVMVIAAVIALWFVLTIETFTFFDARAAALKVAEEIRHERWLGQMALSILWSLYAAVLAAVGFVRRAAAIRWAALSLFAVTIVKVMMVDVAVLTQLYRIFAFLVLGLLLLVVAWGYHKAFQSRESST